MSDSSDSSEISSVQEDEFLGPAARQDIDIVVIHGDEGKKERPTDLENAQPLQDLLSGRIREIRAKITFEYEVEATFGADKSPGFDEAAVNLLETIWKNNEQYHANTTGRSRDSRYTRFIPLVMIAHGLGGRIVQRALFLARRSVKYRSIELRTELLIFVGTPQYSSDYNKFMDDLVWGEVRREFLSFASRYRILSIYQDIKISSSKDIFFLNFPTEKRLTRNTQYTDLGQFSLEDEDLKVLTREITGLLKPSHFDNYYDDYLAVLQSFNKKKFLNIYQNESLAQHRSFNRMAEEYQQFKIWLSEPTSKILLVSGNEGSGKGLASQYLMREAEKHYKKSDIDTLSASFTFSFFDDRYNNLEALFTSLVLQLLLVEPTLFTFLADVEAGSISNMLSDDMNEPAVSRLWRLMKTLLSYRGQCAIVCGINALHDCKSDYTTFLDDLKHFCGISEANFKIVITSVYDGIRLKIPLSIALDHLEMSPTPKSARDTKTSLGAEPAQSIISRTLCRLTDYGQDRSLRMLAWVTYGFRPLELPELATAMALDFVDAQEPDSMDCDPIHGWYSRDISAEIQLSLGDIAEIHGTEVIIANLHLRQAVTEEVRRRANRPDSSSKTKGEKSKATELFKNINHLTITQMCLGYLSVERMERVYEFLRGQHLPHSGPYRDNFCMYAAQYWPAHYVSIQVLTAEVVTTPALYAAIKVGNKAAAKIILVLKSSVTEANESATDEESRTRSYPSSLLHLAVANGNVDLLSMLASEDLPIDVRDAKNRTPLHLASMLSYQDMTRHLISMKIDVNAKDVVGRTALHYAALMGHLEIVKELLLQDDIEIDEKDLEGDTPLSLATKMRQREVVEELLEKKASPKKYNKLGDTALHIAIRNADEFIVRLIAAAEDVNLEARAKNSFTPLLLAADCGHLVILKHLLSRGAEMNVRAVNDITPLHLAAEKGHVAVAEFLIQNGAEIDYLGNATSRPFHLAAEAGHVALVKMLLQYNACIEGKSRDNRTPLIFASAAGNVETVRCLVNHGAKPNQQDSNDQTALSVAAKRGYRQIIDILLEAAESDKKLKWEQVDLGKALQAAI
ncbi:hypothetical protein A0O28_0077380 [Trichoderma guizhouense]|uniref:Nephrocystin 3-like N-terminal domain-containing protein n=1 Tax=Trichoderma guizhouense TaxID=1491466 RepID=A0A1T3CWQ3_9HYPO|nr:hypothetical protein A0O28_0077380 [Trichoderma guizhouense]